MTERHEELVGADNDIAVFKDYLSEPRFRIRLDDHLNLTMRAVLAETSAEKLPLNTPRMTADEFEARLAAYEAALKPLQAELVSNVVDEF